MAEAFWYDNSLTLLQKLKLQLRIADEEAGYPSCEARYSSILDYEKQTGNSFGSQLEVFGRAADGIGD